MISLLVMSSPGRCRNRCKRSAARDPNEIGVADPWFPTRSSSRVGTLNRKSPKFTQRDAKSIPPCSPPDKAPPVTAATPEYRPPFEFLPKTIIRSFGTFIKISGDFGRFRKGLIEASAPPSHTDVATIRRRGAPRRRDHLCQRGGANDQVFQSSPW